MTSIPASSGIARPSLDLAVRKTLFNTFVAVGCMMAITGLAAVFSLGLQLGLGTALIAFAISMVLIFATNRFKNSPVGLVLLALFGLVQGVFLGPLLNHYLKMAGGTGVVAAAAGLTALAVFSCAGYVLASKRDFTRWGGFLMGSTIVLIVAMLGSMFFPIPALHIVISAVSAILFMGWMLHDVSRIVSGQETSYVSAALGIYLNVLNIFTSLLRLLGFLPSSD